MTASAVYETINYAWALVSAFMIAFLLRYLYEGYRELGWRAFVFDRPKPEQFAIAILIADGGNMGDRIARGAWRSIGGDLDNVAAIIVIAVIVCSITGMIGVLCKLRIVSIARHGHWPWLTALCTVVAFVTTWVTLHSTQ